MIRSSRQPVGSRALWLLAATLAVTVLPAWAATGPEKVGEVYPVLLQTPHPAPMAAPGKPAWLEIVSHPGASYIAVHFSRLRLGPGEQVVLRTPDGRYSYTYRGEGKPGAGGRFWAAHVPGDTCEVLLLGNGTSAGWGFAIDEYAAGYPLPGDPTPAQPEALCGADDSEWAKCYETTEPQAYQRGRAVARLLINGSGACTGWLVGTAGHLITNNHCIETASDALNTDFEFIAEGATCATNCGSWFACPGTVVADTSTLVKTNAPRDYSLVLLPVNPTGTYGYLQLRQAGPSLGDRLYIPQHPAAYGKKIAVWSTDSRDPGGYPTVVSLTEPACQTGGPPDVGYYADTQGGSSGSPVLGYADHKVIALHHCGGCPSTPNTGVPIQEVIAHLGTDLPPGAVEDAPNLTTIASKGTDSCAAGGPGSGDTVIDPGELASLELTVGNSGNLVAASPTITLSTTSPAITLLDATAALPDLAPGATAVNADPLLFSVAPDAACGTSFSISVTLAAGERTWPGTLSFKVGNVTAEATLLLGEDFEGATFPPTGWAQFKTGDASSAGFRGGQSGASGSHGDAHGGTSFAWHDDENLSSRAIDWLVLPQVAVPAAGAVLKLWERDYYTTYYEYHGVWVTTGASADPAVSTYLELVKLAAPGGTWKQTTVDLASYAGQTVFVALRYTGDNKDEWYLDDLELWASSCAATPCNPAGQRYLSVARAGNGAGSVTSTPPGIDCGSTCAAFFPEGSTVDLAAAAATGSTFTGWSGACTGTDPCQVTMDQARAVTATFTLERHTLTVDRTGTGSGTVTSTPPGIDCGATCSAQFDYQTAVSLAPTAATGSTFTGWSGACSGTGACQVAMDQARSVTAAFTLQQHTLTVTKAGTGGGGVTSTPPGIDCGATCSASFDHGTLVDLAAAADTDSSFAGWSGACTGTGACQVSMTEARSVTATFNRLPQTLSVSKDGTGAGTVSSTPVGIDCGTTCSVAFPYNTPVSLAATAAIGSTFSGWTGACTGTGGCSVTMDQARAVTATFTLLASLQAVRPLVDPAVTATSDGNGILEPGERVILSPIWHNPGTLGKATSGIVSLFGGAAGPTYTIQDAAASYGTVAAGADANPWQATANAYELEVPVPASRPALHWDAQITETLATAEVRVWTLHLGDSFTDVLRGNWAYPYVERLLHGGLTTGTTGCPGDRLYCPADLVTRDQMAVFLARGLAGGDATVPQTGTVPDVGDYDCSPGGTSRFADVLPESWFCRHAHYIWAENVTTGCVPAEHRYCPAATVPRDQMAVFMARVAAGGDALVPAAYTDTTTGRTYDCGTVGGTHFTDVTTGHWACKYVHYIWALGQVDGCDAPNHLFCPDPPVRRDEMAKFL
ncbi:MAG: choice-of-anchor J domain-containing protein, partial [Thermoanaerobaculaceae bacterium]|nr:choice-of-anchor J domain-containing protein [Thermoanaerobaculaceae bacterium]